METVKVYQTENDFYKDMKLFGKLKYIGKSFGVVSLTNNKIYDCVGYDEQGWLQIVDDSEEDYCYSEPNQLLYVTVPDYDSVNGIIDLVNVVEEGGTLEDTESLN